MELREATEEDFDAIVRLVPTQHELYYVYPGGQHPFTVGQLRSLAARRCELTVAIEDGEVVGFANLYDVEPPASAFIGNVVVANACRGSGIGRAIVSYMIQKAYDMYGVNEVRISVFNDNTPALLLYAGLGFQPYAIDRRIDPNGRRVGLLHMKLGRGEETA